MKIEQKYFVAGAREARGVTIVIDVFRACSLVAHALAAGAQRIVPVAGIDEALALKAAHPDWVLVGERHARRLPGFECGNSPSDLLRLPLAGRTVIHTTHAGTQGLTAAAAAPGVQLVLTGALVNAAATVRHVQRLAPDEVTIVAMGHEARERCVEDDLCAELLEARLRGAAFDVAVVEPRLRAAPAAAKFFDPAADWAPEADFALCASVDAIDFAVQLVQRPGAAAVLERVA
jgi:2-phosphosulfolactate phosphatase